jgi:hypothetical protein
MSYEHRLVEVVNNPPSGETYDAIGRDADAEIAALKAENAALRAAIHAEICNAECPDAVVERLAAALVFTPEWKV